MFPRIVLLLSTFFMLYSPFSIAFALLLPQSGQTGCWDSSGASIACAGTGQDGELRSGVAWPTPRFTDNGDQTITDNLTGLIWTKDANAPGPVACGPAATKTWQGALDYVKCLNTNSYLGKNDWRLPNRKELYSLVNKQQASPSTWLNAQGFSNVLTNKYWSGSTHAYYTSHAWIVGMGGGGVSYDYKTGDGYYVWPVRGGQ